ncbi:succinate receptor 1-like [Amia ocellicauda]|uniref:succinate receptor 1-like n=1 Tax=Amia ocellicauda TaxID=2972642 RepID=UPI0034645264
MPKTHPDSPALLCASALPAVGVGLADERQCRSRASPPETDFCISRSPGMEPLLLVELYLIPGFFLGVLVVGIALNLLSLWIFFRRCKQWNRSTLFLCNLTLADTSWLLGLPFLIQYRLRQLNWTLGLPLCKLVRILYHNYFYVSIYFVSCVSVDRYLAIAHPLTSISLLSKRQSLLLCLAIWALSMVMSYPVAQMATTQHCPGTNSTICTMYVFLEDTSESLPYSLCCTVIGFLLPFTAICYCYCRSARALSRQRHFPRHASKRRKLAGALYSALFIFAVLYLPYHVTRNLVIVMRAAHPRHGASSYPDVDLVFAVEMCICSLNTCINPLFIFLTGSDFRLHFKSAFSGWRPCRCRKGRGAGPHVATVCPL